jgi:hypothetical protein
MLLALIALLSTADAHPANHQHRPRPAVVYVEPLYYEFHWVRAHYNRFDRWVPGHWERNDVEVLICHSDREGRLHCDNR